MSSSKSSADLIRKHNTSMVYTMHILITKRILRIVCRTLFTISVYKLFDCSVNILLLSLCIFAFPLIGIVLGSCVTDRDPESF